MDLLESRRSQRCFLLNGCDDVRFPYDQAQSPPAPVVTLELSSPSSEKKVLLTDCLIDTGADVSIIPAKVGRELELQRWGDARVEGLFDGVRAGFESYVQLEIGRILLDGFVVVLEDGITILGRDILNRLTLTLNGKETVVEM